MKLLQRLRSAFLINERRLRERKKKGLVYSKRRGEWNVNSARFQPYNWPRGKYHKLIRSICKSRYGAASRILFIADVTRSDRESIFIPPLCRTGARDSDFSTSINQENRNILLSAGLHRIIEFFNGDVRSDDTRGHFSFLSLSLLFDNSMYHPSLLDPFASKLFNCCEFFFLQFFLTKTCIYIYRMALNILDVVRYDWKNIELGFV